MGLFDGIRRQWHEMKSTNMIKNFGKVLDTKFSGTYRAYVYEIMGEKFLHLSVFVTEETDTVEFNRDELLVIIEKFEEAIKILSSSRGSLREVRKESRLSMIEGIRKIGRFWSDRHRVKEEINNFGNIKEVIKDFGIIARQGTKDRITETRVVLAEPENEKVIYVSRREREKGLQSLVHLAFNESDAVSMLSVFKNALPFM